jgi:CBS domain containing-hemolysin-like protein
MEDLLECVFGEIASPSDNEVVPRHLMSDMADGRRLIDTSMLLDDFSQEFGVRIESEEVETLAGALLQAFGELPASGATIELCGLRFTVEDLEHNRITRVLVERLPVPVALVEGEAASAESAALPPAGEGSDQPPVDQSNRKEGL